MTNVCIICESRTHPYFTKQYAETKLSDALLAEYFKCPECGFVYSRTHQEMPKSNWEALNLRCHKSFESDLSSRTINQPPYAGMAMAMNILAKNGIIHIDRSLDYAAGYGTLSKILSKYFGTNIDCYDKYVFDNSSTDYVHYVSSIALGDYPLVINSAMFEHVVARQDLDEVNGCVAADGVLMLHTLVCENVPADPEWFYLDPIVHCAFHTNKSMGILMNQWGYSDSIYAPIAKSWFLFKKDNPAIEDLAGIVKRINSQFQSEMFHHKKGFVDFWKGF
jgi:hypothetical protein